jgi:phosphate-selective porin
MPNRDALVRKICLGIAGLALTGATSVFAQSTPAVQPQRPAAATATDPAAAERARLREDLDRLEAQLRAIKERLQALEPSAPSPSAAAVPPAAPAPPTSTTPTIVQTASAQTEPAEFESRTGPISGYMDFHFNKPEGGDGVLDFHRFVLLFNHSFTDRLRFVGELELEHSLVEGLEEAGELELEQAYIDYLITPKVNLRAGMLLMPVGLINERHEPPSFYGVERPFVDTVIIPSTWFDLGAGVHGDLGRGLSYRAYVTAPLDATGFSAAEGIREGRQKGSQSNVRDVALTGRLEYRGAPGLVLGTSFWQGKTAFETRRIHSSVGLVEFDGRYTRGRLEARGEFAQVFIDGAGELNDAVTRTIGVSPNIASELRGFYLEGGYRVAPSTWTHDLGVFVRYENFDTQYRMPAGYQPLGEFDRAAWVAGVNYYPDPDVAVKFDYIVLKNRSGIIRAPNSFNVGLGWWF